MPSLAAIRRVRALPALAAALVLALPVGCARNPTTGRPDLVLVSSEREREIGREEAAKVEQSIGHVEDPVLQEWVSSIGSRIAGFSPRQDVEYRFHVLDMIEPNAFALPGGHVYVSRGLLALVNSEDALACVLGHEIAHVAARHSVRRVTVATPFALALGLPTAVVGSISDTLGSVLGGVSSLAAGAVIAPYSRQQERAADRLGLELAAQAGWDPTAMARFLHTLEREEQLKRNGSRRPRFFDSHPSTPSRVRNTERHAGGLERGPRSPSASTPSALLDRLDGLMVGENPDRGVFVDGSFLHPELGFAIRFPEGWRTANVNSYVAAVEPAHEDILSILQLAGEGDDPAAGAVADGLDEEVAKKLEPVDLGGLAAVRIVSTRRGKGFDLTWVAHRGHVYRIVGTGPEGKFERLKPIFREVAFSFHPLTEAERDRIEVGRLRIARARAGESLEALIERTGSSWSVEEAGIANGIEGGGELGAGQPVKLAIPERHAGSRG